MLIDRHIVPHNIIMVCPLSPSLPVPLSLSLSPSLSLSFSLSLPLPLHAHTQTLYTLIHTQTHMHTHRETRHTYVILTAVSRLCYNTHQHNNNILPVCGHNLVSALVPPLWTFYSRINTVALVYIYASLHDFICADMPELVAACLIWKKVTVMMGLNYRWLAHRLQVTEHGVCMDCGNIEFVQLQASYMDHGCILFFTYRSDRAVAHLH